MCSNHYWIGSSLSLGICQVSITLFSSCDPFLLCFIILSLTICHMSRIRILTSKITQVCQDIHDIKLRRLLLTRSDNEPNDITNPILTNQMIVRILWVQAEADLTLQTLMKIVLRVVTTTLTELPIPSNTTLRTTKRIMEDVLLNRCQHLPE